MDITAEQFKEAARKAYAAGDIATARKLIARAKAAGGEKMERVEAAKAGTLTASPQSLERAANADDIAFRQMNTDMSAIGRIKDNVIGVNDAITSPGEQAAPLIRGLAAGAARGLADVPAIPANIAQLGAMGVEKLAGMESPSMVSRALDRLPDTRKALASVPVIGPESEFVAPGRVGQFMSTMGEFSGGAGGTLGVKNMLRFGAVPGAASELAGQATEGTAAEPYARAAAALGTSLAMTPRPQNFGRGLARVDDEARDSADYLARQGVRPTAGQVLDSDRLMKMEGTLSATPAQQEAFTRAALKTAGNETAKRATPQVLKKTQDAITTRMNNILDIDAPIPPSFGTRVMAIADDHFAGTAGAELPVPMRRVANQLLDISTSPTNNTIPAGTLREWRTILGGMTTSGQENTRFAAHALRDVIDDVTEEALKAAGRADDVKTLAGLRTQYRNFLVLADASTKGGREGARGLLSPERVDSAAKRVIGRTNSATDKGTEISKLGRRGVGVVGAKSTVSPGGIRDVLTPLLSSAGLGGAAAASGMAGGAGLLGTLGLFAAGAALPPVGRGLLNSGMVQSALMDAGNFMRPVAGAAPGILGTLSARE